MNGTEEFTTFRKNQAANEYRHHHGITTGDNRNTPPNLQHLDNFCKQYEHVRAAKESRMEILNHAEIG